ncbi:hypothetical protein ASPTUDRAFT_28228 [Aspergillus tubingensis CBS 134.48]|uniref:Uncharacterized protein n=1 Tax=Aspergillus tubingensis (strain CBS 134.48) TaxID=767770 RepID=A0A1L9NDL0_ASPTC|nr:hypothetical protein ASPTUDRAFT_28228 [Aspergillus tubingensis CBS 134.48]
MTHSNPSKSSKESSDSESEVLGPWNELHIKIRAMFREVRSLGESAASLDEWAQTIDPDKYRKMDPWPQDLIDAHAQYKEYVDSIKPAHYAYIAYAQRLTDGEVEDTCETRMKILEICLRWGEAALVATEARLGFLDRYRNAFKDKKAIVGHIKQANANRDSARNAVKWAGKNYRRYWQNMIREQKYGDVFGDDGKRDTSNAH